MQQLVPAVVLLEDRVHLILRHDILQLGRVVTIRDAHEQTVLERLDIEHIDITRAGEQDIGVIIDILAHPEVTAVGVTQGLEDRRLVVIALGEHLDHLFGLLLLLDDRSVLRNNLQHPFLDRFDHLPRQYGRFFLLFRRHRFVLMPLEGAVITLADRVLHTQVHLRVEFVHRSAQNHA